MKKVILIAGLAIIALAFASPANAQINTRVGPMLSFTSGDFDETGLGVVAEFGVANKLSISPQFILYFPGNNYGLFEFNVNANYYFFAKNAWEIYGLGGLNFARAHYDNPNGEDSSNSELGLNLGAGVNFEINDKIVPFSELRATLGDYDQFMIAFGVKFNLN